MSASPTQTASSTREARAKQRPYSDVNPPPRRAGDFVVKVLLVTRTAPAADGHPSRWDRTALEFWEEVRTCVTRSSPHREEVGWKDWRAEGMDGRVYPADASGQQPLRTPAYPVHQVLSPGRCVTGWWLITAPKGAGLRAIQFAPGGGATLIEWLTMA